MPSSAATLVAVGKIRIGFLPMRLKVYCRLLVDLDVILCDHARLALRPLPDRCRRTETGSE